MAKKTSPVNKAVKKAGEARTKVVARHVNTKSVKRVVTAKSNQADLKRQIKIQKALYEIADAASAVRDMQSFYKDLHRIVGKLMYAENFFIALYDKQSNLITWPYYVDTVDIETPAPISLTDHHGATGWVLRHGKTVADADDSWAAAMARGEGQAISTDSDGIAVPLKVKSGTIGVVLIQSYIEGIGYQLEDVKVLEFVAQHIATALTRARALEAERLRTEELAIINAVQEGLARKLDFRGIIDLLGEKIGEIFEADTVDAGMYDAERDWTSTLYYVDRGQRTPLPDNPAPRPSLIALLVDTRKPLLLGTGAEAVRLGSLRIPSGGAEKDKNESYLGVPILTGDKVIGWMAVQRYQQHAYDEDDLRLLQTLANSMSVALENARLFDETQRLLKETEERNVELAIINSVQAALAAELNIQGIYDAVGDKIRDIFDKKDVSIRIYDPQTKMEHFPYTYENGERITIPSQGIGEKGFGPYIYQTRATLLINENIQQEAEKYGSSLVPGTAAPKSQIMVPLITGEQARGLIEIVDMEREHAFSELGRAFTLYACEQYERCPRKCAALRRDPASAQRDRTAQCRTCRHQQRAGSAGCRTQHPGHLRRGGRQDSGDLSRHRYGHSHL